jgi:tetratricopeptide (TPR) repeat protein
MSAFSHNVAFAVAFAAAVALPLQAAHAQTPAPPPATAPAAPAAQDATAGAREHYQKGTAFYDLGRYPEAIHEFEAAYELKNDPALLYNLAQSYRLAGNAEQALHFYRTYLRRVPKAPNRAEIEERITALEAQVAQKNAAPNTPPPINDTTPRPKEVAGGGNNAVVSPTPTPTPISPPPPTALPPPAPGPSPNGGDVSLGLPPPMQSNPPRWDRGRKMQIAGLGGIGLGGLLFLVGIIEGGRAAAASNEIDNAAKAGKAFDPAVEQRGKSAESAEKALLLTGLVIGAGGGLLYYYGRRAHEQAAAGMISLAPSLSAQGPGALLRVTF